MKILAFIFLALFFSESSSSEKISNYRKYKTSQVKYKLEKVASSFDYPWGLTFIDKDNLLVTEKNGRLVKVNVKTGKTLDINHNIQSIRYDGESIAYQQGGLLDVYSHNDGHIYFSYSHDFKETIGADKKPSKSSSTAIARGKLSGNEIKNLEILLVGKPKIHTNKHFGSRIVIKDDYLFAGFGERDAGMIAQDPTQHPGSIIRIKKDGSIPIDNPTFKDHPEWLPEIYLIGVRNPQGMAISPHNQEIYFSQHGPMGGDNISKVTYAANFGWKDVAWGGSEYSGKKIGNVPFKDKYNKPIITWVPSMAIGNIQFYHGNAFPEWKGDLIVSATKAQMLLRLNFENNQIVDKEIILKDKIGRIRDFEIDHNGNIFIITDESNSSLWRISAK